MSYIQLNHKYITFIFILSKRLTAMQRVLLFFFLFWFSSYIYGQNGTGYINPYQTVYNHLDYLQDDNYDPAISARSFPSDVDSLERVDAAIKLKRIYDGRGIYVKVSRIPKDSLYRDSLARDYVYFPYPDLLPDVYLERTGGLWTYSLETVDQLDQLYKQTYPFGLSKIIEMVPDQQGSKFLGLYTWQYLGILILALLVFVLYFIFNKIFDLIFSRVLRNTTFLGEEKLLSIKKVDGYISLSLLTLLIIYLLPILKLPVKFSVFLQNAGKIFLTVFIMMLLLGLVNVLKSYLKSLTSITDSRLDDQLLPILIKFIKIIIVIGAVFNILNLLNVNVTAIIAGISIGGLALALAAQDTVKNLFGSMMIFFDKPFQIGDYIIAGDIEGSVVEVGFRSTRIKKIDTSILSVPNGNLANMSLTNLGVRNFRLMKTSIGLTYDTSSEKLKAFVAGLHEIAKSHPIISEEGKYIHLSGLGASSIDIMFRLYIETIDYAEELKIKEDITYQIIELAEKVGVSFAFPSTSVYVEQLPKK